MRKMFVIALAGMSCACAAAGPPPDPALLGPRPTIDPESQIRTLMEGHLRDPYSAVYRRVGGPVPGRAQEALIHGGKVVEGWGYCYTINAKNAFGGYTGAYPYYFVFRDNQLVGWAGNPQLSSWNCF